MFKILLTFAVFAIPVIALPQDKNWPQEPDGFNGLKFLAPKADVEKIVKLGACKPYEGHNPTPLEMRECKVSLVLDGINVDGYLQFSSEKGKPASTGQLTSIRCIFEAKNYSSVKAALIRLYGEPHQLQKLYGGGADGVFWHGKKANIMLSPIVVSFSPTQYVIGGVVVGNHFDMGASMSTTGPVH
jgi:hypothetical protein